MSFTVTRCRNGWIVRDLARPGNHEEFFVAENVPKLCVLLTKLLAGTATT